MLLASPCNKQCESLTKKPRNDLSCSTWSMTNLQSYQLINHQMITKMVDRSTEESNPIDADHLFIILLLLPKVICALPHQIFISLMKSHSGIHLHKHTKRNLYDRSSRTNHYSCHNSNKKGIYLCSHAVLAGSQCHQCHCPK